VLSDPLPASWVYVASSPAASSAPAVGGNGTLSVHRQRARRGLGHGAIVGRADHHGQQHQYRNLVSQRPGRREQCHRGHGGLVLGKSTTTPTRSAGDSAHYVVTIDNSLASPVSGLSLTDALPTAFPRAGSTLGQWRGRG
jgi:uncharacterized repeat protein (TIGR01451 family)